MNILADVARWAKWRVTDTRYKYGISSAARAEMKREARPESWKDIPIDSALSEALAWIGRAQDNSASADGGVARHFCLLTGWGRSYPETTGYIVPTLIREGHIQDRRELLSRARKMLDWLVSIQLPSGAFLGSTVGNAVVAPVTFNTGQILIGLAAGVTEFGPAYRPAMLAAADWLTKTQDSDGCWRKHPTPFARPGVKTYDTHAAWGLFEAARLEPNAGYDEAAMRNLRWALAHQDENGWFDECCLSDPTQPLTHTLGYVLRGLIAGYEFTGDRKMLGKACQTAEGALGAMHPNGFLSGRLDSRWRGTVPWSCLTGTAQIAACWLLLYRATRDVRYRDAAITANRYVRSTVRIDGPLETRGAVKGSFPVSGEYAKFQYPNWACKFFIDANRLEKAVHEEEGESPVQVRGRSACVTD